MSTDFAKLRFWLLGLVLLVIFPSMIFLIFEAAWEQRNDARLQAQQTALRVAQLAAMEQERLITGAHHLLMTLAELPEVRETRADACNKLFAAVMKKFPYYTNVAAATPRGEIFCSGLPNHPTINIADRAYFQAALKERQLGISHVLLGRMSGKPNISMAYPSFDSDGPVHAVVFVGLDLGWLNFMATKAQMPPQSVLVAMDEKGTIFARYPDPEKWLGKSVDHELARTILERKEGVTEAEGLDGVRRLYGFTTLHRGSNGEALFVRVGIPNEVAFASSDRIFYRSLMFLLVVSLLAAAGTWFGTHLLVRRRLDALVTAARELGDVEIQKTRSAAPELAKIPVGQYGEVVDEMWSSLQRVATRQADIAAMIAHDLRNPIQTTGLAAAMLLQSGERLTEEQQSLVKGIQASCDELGRIIKDFMDFSKFRAGYLELDREEVDVPVLLQRTQQKYSPLARKRQLNLKTHVEFGIGTAYVDQQKMEQLIGNLISNAVKFTPTGGEIELGARKTNGGVEIWVGDTGMGIEHGELQQLFAKYQQTSSARKSSEEGTGLGLLICRMIAEGHGGRIWVDSEVNQRTIFHVWLPTQEEEIYLPAGTA